MCRELKIKLKQKTKTLMIALMTIMLTITNLGLLNVRAESAVTSRISHQDWWLADPSTGRRDSHEAELFIGGQQAFCIDAFAKFKSGVTMHTVNFEDVGISRETAVQLSLISYFGTKVSGRTGKDWYAITQGLIWKTIHYNSTDICYVETPTNPDYATTVRLWNEILADVENYKRTPSFATQTFEVDADKSITLTDTNNA